MRLIFAFIIVAFYFSGGRSARAELPEHEIMRLDNYAVLNDVGVAFWDSIIANNPDSDYALGMKVTYLATRVGIGEAVEFVGAIDESAFGNGTYVNTGVANLYSIGGDRVKAEFFYKKALELDKSGRNIWARIGLATLLFNQNKIGEAFRMFNKALQIDRSNPYLLSTLAESYIIKSDFKNAEKFLNLIPKKYDPARVNFLKAKSKFLQADFKAAEEFYKKSLAIDINSMDVRVGLIETYGATGEYEKAEEILNELEGKYPENHILNYHRGVILYHKKIYADAAKQFRLAVERFDSNPNYYIMLARSLHSTGKDSDAEAALSAYKSKYGGQYNIDANLLALQIVSGKLDNPKSSRESYFMKYSNISDINAYLNEIFTFYGVEKDKFE